MRIRNPSARSLVVLALIATGLIAGCGGSDSTSDSSATTTADAADFPTPDNESLQQIAQQGEASDLVIAPTESVFEAGKSRYGFGVFTVKHEAVDDADIALYAAQANGKATGPFPATVHSLATQAAFTSQTTSSDPDAAKYFYTSEVDFPDDGNYSLVAMIREDDGSYSYANVTAPAQVGNPKNVPQPGDKAPVMHTPTADDVGGDLTKIDTRQPPDSMHDVDYGDVLGKDPIVLLFATPALCTSRVCGPVVDIAEEVKSERPDDAAYIHMEVYNDNDPNKGPRPQLQDFNLMSEPWLFVIGKDGKVSTVIEGAFSKQELEDAIDKADAAA